MDLSPDGLKPQDLLKAEVKGKMGVRSYEIVTEAGRKFRRNCVHLRKSSETFKPHLSTAGNPFERGTMVPAVTRQDPIVNKPPDKATPTSITEQPLNNAQEPNPSVPVNVEGLRRTRYGREARRPEYLNDYV